MAGNANDDIYIATCLIEGRRYYATLLSLLGNRKVGYFHGYAHHSVTVALHGNQQQGQCFHWASQML
jgi:hypothetical protein